MTIKKSLIIQAILLSIVSLSAQNVTVNLDEEHQTIRGFGGMVHNTWQGGAGLSAEDAKLAFGAGEGQLGLTALRIPVNESKNDFGKELAVAKLAQSHGAIVYASPWNPPSNLRDGNRKIPESNWQAYVDHLNSFSAYMKDQGAPLYAISIQNEPDWCHEWTCWSADELYKFTKNYGNQLRKNGTKVITAESFAYVKTLYDKILNDATALSNVDIIGAHFYASTAASGDNFFQYSLADQKAKNQERWMTEHYTESQGSGNMWRAYIKTGDQDQQAKYDTVRALDVGYEIHRGLVVGNFNQYTWWYIRRCYGLIMEKDFGNKLTIPSNEIGKVSKRGYVLSQYARFVRPGAIRVGATAKPMNHVFASAYKKEDSVVVVLINRDASATKTLNISVPGATSITSWTKYTTSATKNVSNDGEISATNGSFSVTLDKESIVTLVGTGPQIVIPQGPYDSLNVPTIPGKIEAENYDVGGHNKAYYDEESENKGKAYREEGVDIEGNETD
ncbi:MAG TPA: glycoside hydrolase family 30 beta sandwich domain-containing protein, partial [Fibrobacteraceae bacterium]|nr:glycoside hydrolase family 30 beta sandwich domain-containing protein [Fibrobacteraceae bacterium]